MTRSQAKERGPELFGADAKDEASTAKPAAPKAKPIPKAKSTAVAKVDPAPSNLLAAIMSASADPRCDGPKIHVLLDARDRVGTQEAEAAFWNVYGAVQDELPSISKDNKIVIEKNGRTVRSTPYASYENLWKIIKPILSRHKLRLLLSSEPGTGGTGVQIRATLAFVSQTSVGLFTFKKECVVPMPPDPTGSKNAAQAISSALSYAKRNALIIALNIETHAPQDRDLDGNHPDKVATEAAPKVISPTQLKELTQAIADAGATASMVCNKYGVEDVAELAVADFKLALGALEKFKKEKAARDARNAP